MSNSNSTEIHLEQEERRHTRLEDRLEACLIVQGEPWRCWIRDISIGGAGLEPAIPAALGKQVVLSSAHFEVGMSLNGRVINVAKGKTCINFELDVAGQEKLVRFLADANK